MRARSFCPSCCSVRTLLLVIAVPIVLWMIFLAVAWCYIETNINEPFDRMCAGAASPSHEKATNLCYLKNDHPALILSPIKCEIVHTHPLVILFHEAITKAQQRELIEAAKPKLQFAKVNNNVLERWWYGRKSKLDTWSRTAKNAFLHDSLLKSAKAINRRIELMTNLGMSDDVEMIQLNQYKTHGYYRPHFDVGYRECWETSSNITEWAAGDGARIATLMFYFACYQFSTQIWLQLNQPRAGGGTIFVDLGLKGAAIFWHNLHSDGRPDWRTRHSGCPVNSGLKWVANVWFRERSQAFHRPCGLTAYLHDEKSSLGWRHGDKHLDEICDKSDCM